MAISPDESMNVSPRASTVMDAGRASAASLMCAQNTSTPVMSNSPTTTMVGPLPPSRLVSTYSAPVGRGSTSSDIRPPDRDTPRCGAKPSHTAYGPSIVLDVRVGDGTASNRSRPRRDIPANGLTAAPAVHQGRRPRATPSAAAQVRTGGPAERPAPRRPTPVRAPACATEGLGSRAAPRSNERAYEPLPPRS